ncbi:MAG: AzlD domain-containing protein [Acidimicrobiia bacterium]|nr:AzlD domain-containing protein [Acidimicrobiia bacterium]
MSSPTTVWLAFLLGGLVTYAQRASFLLILGDRSLPAPVQRALRYVAPAAFAAIVAPRIFDSVSVSEFTAPDARLLAAVIGGVLMWKVRNLPVLLVVGMVVFWLLRWVGL